MEGPATGMRSLATIMVAFPRFQALKVVWCADISIPRPSARSSRPIRIGTVSIRDKRIFDRPIDAERWIVPTESGGSRGVVEIGHLIGHFSVVHQCLESMPEAGGYVKRDAILSRKFHGAPFAERVGVRPDIDNNVVNCAPCAPDQLDLFVRCPLEMNSA